VSPLSVSNVSSDVRNAQGVPDVVVTETTPTISTRVPVAEVLVKGRMAEEISPLATVKLTAVPMAVPPDVVNEIVPVQEAAAPLAEAVALLATLICMVSLEARPTGGKSKLRAAEAVVVCADAEKAIKIIAISGRMHFRKIIVCVSPDLSRRLVCDGSFGAGREFTTLNALQNLTHGARCRSVSGS